MWWDRYWRKFLRDMERDFEELERMMDRMFKAFEGEAEVRGPYVYGFSITVGPDGKPIVRRFGNVKPPVVEEAGYREPFVDVIVDNKANEVRVIAEIPGVTKDKIDVEVTEKLVKIRAENDDRKYRTQVDLPVEVDPKSAKARYNNGILEITLTPKQPIKEEGTKIKIE